MVNFYVSLFLLLASSGAASAYSFVQTPNARSISGLRAPNAGSSKNSHDSMTMFLGQTKTTKTVTDTTTIGTTPVPSVGVGTISWSSDSRKYLERTN